MADGDEDMRAVAMDLARKLDALEKKMGVVREFGWVKSVEWEAGHNANMEGVVRHLGRVYSKALLELPMWKVMVTNHGVMVNGGWWRYCVEVHAWDAEHAVSVVAEDFKNGEHINLECREHWKCEGL